jgi:hypothetical protein
MKPLTLAEREAVYLMRWKRKPDARTVLPPMMPWERPGYVVTAKPRVVRQPIKPVAPVYAILKPKQKRVGRPQREEGDPNDTSPLYIRKIRAAFCAEFIKTGNINVELQQKLKRYANECRAASKHPPGISAELAPRRLGRAASDAGDDSRRDVHQTDDAIADRVAEFLRLP